ncbi:MAG: beta-N-acetylhexosaminidase [Ruminococcaceae bacterium]|nr:beta-N-acetylhexosaminidase [Oscillospiraceae bacterium]
MEQICQDKLSFAFDVDASLMSGILRLQDVIGFSLGEGIAVTAEKAELPGVSLYGGKAVIRYSRKSYFFRGLGILAEHLRLGEDCFTVSEDGFFTEMSVMLDSSRCAVPTVDGICRMLDYLAVMGYTMAMLYTEDTVKLESRPYLGYMRGRYSPEELRAVDDYAWEYGIEVIPCLECYGHMERYLRWGEAARIKDTERVLLAREDKTFEFLDELIGHVSSCFRSRRIHIGMDEAWDMGRGAFLTRNGYVPPFQIFTEYMERLIGITNKYGLTPMMWSDMYFRVCTTNNRYCGEDIEVTPEVAEKIPSEVELVFWHYGEKDRCDDYMLKKHNALGRKVIFAGGLWSWIGHFPEHNYVMETLEFSLNACRNNNVREAMITLWLNDNAECDIFANLFGLSYFAEMCYDKNVSGEKLRARFEACTGGNYDAFYAMSYYHNRFGEGIEYKPYNGRFFGKPLFWQDIMEGIYDARLQQNPMSDHYAASAEIMKQYSGGRWEYLYDFAYRVFDYLALKTHIAETLVPVYLAGDRDALREIADVLLPQLKEKVIGIHAAHREMWHDHCKAFGWRGLDERYGGMANRCDTAKMIIDRYLDGKLDRIEELDEPRLGSGLSGFVQTKSIVV